MRVFAAVAACLLLCAPAGMAQINVQGEDGSTVSIGPNGISINGTNTGSRANVKLGPGGIQIDSANGGNRSRVNLGAGSYSTGGGTSRITRTTRHVTPTLVKTTTTSKTVQPSGSSATEQVRLIELKIYGQSFPNKPLMARIEKLEVDNLGQKGSGPLKTRINILAKELGVTLTETSTTVVNSQNSTVEVTTHSPEAANIRVKEVAPSHASSTTVMGNVLSDLVVNESNQIIKGHCNGNVIVLNGNNCQLQLSGKLGEITINGNHNHIKSEKIAVVVANGNSNSVTWAHPQGAPMIQDNGKDNAMHSQ